MSLINRAKSALQKEEEESRKRSAQRREKYRKEAEFYVKDILKLGREFFLPTSEDMHEYRFEIDGIPFKVNLHFTSWGQNWHLYITNVPNGEIRTLSDVALKAKI